MLSEANLMKIKSEQNFSQKWMGESDRKSRTIGLDEECF